METWYLLFHEKFLFWIFWWWKIRSFFSQNVDGKMIFTDYWKVLVLNFLVMGNTVSFWIKKLMERWYFTGYWKALALNFLVMGDFFQPKGWWKDDIYLVFFSSRWYSRTLGIWFFVQWRLTLTQVVEEGRSEILSCKFPFYILFSSFVS